MGSLHCILGLSECQMKRIARGRPGRRLAVENQRGGRHRTGVDRVVAASQRDDDSLAAGIVDQVVELYPPGPNSVSPGAPPSRPSAAASM